MQVAALSSSSSSRAALPVASLSTRNSRNHAAARQPQPGLFGRGLSTSLQPSTSSSPSSSSSSPSSSSSSTCAWRIGRGGGGGGGGTQGAPVRLVSPATPPPRAPLSLTSQQTVWLVIAQTIALVGAAVTGVLAHRRREEAELLNAKLRAIAGELRERAADAAEPGACQADEDGESMRAYRMGLEQSLDAPAAAHPVETYGEADLSLAEARRAISRSLGEAKQALKAGCTGDALARTAEALALARELRDARAERAVVRLSARALRAAGDLRGALRELLRSADLSEALGEGSGDADVAGAIADCYADLGDFERAGEWYDRCIAAIQESEEGGKAPVALSSMWDC